MMKAATLAGVILSGALISAGQTTREPLIFFKEQMGLSDDQIAMIARGKAVAKILPSKTPAEIIVLGTVFVKTTPEEYVKLAFDIGRLRRLPSYLGVGRFSDPPVLSDLEGFTLEPEDVRNLKICKPRQCGVQLPAEAMQELQRAPDWAGPDVAAQMNDRVRKMALELLRQYQERGNSVLGSYHDQDHPFDVDAQLRSLLGRSEALPVYLPELKSYLLNYPNATLGNVESLFYWERINFGLRPTLRLNHAIAYRSAGPKGAAQVVAVKQLYASHYFQLALDLTACVTDSGGASSDTGFYLISLKGSIQQGLTGLKGSLLRKVIVGKTRSAQEKALIYIKKTLEEKQ
jgi:hypothetical protein